MAATNHPNRNNRLVAAPRMDYASLFSCVKGRSLHWWVQGPLMVSTVITGCEDHHSNSPRIHRYTPRVIDRPRSRVDGVGNRGIHFGSEAKLEAGSVQLLMYKRQTIGIGIRRYCFIFHDMSAN